MAAKQVFSMANDFTQFNRGWKRRNGAQGICTAASLAWAKKSLQGRRITSFSDLGVSAHSLNAQMAVLRQHDADPARQTEMAGLEMVGNDRAVADFDDLARYVKITTPHVAIFWTAGHTMGYRYAHHRKEFFDIEDGLYWAKLTKDIRKKVNERYGGQVVGVRVVRLPS